MSSEVAPARPWRRRLSIYLELALTALIVWYLYKTVSFFTANGYLPPPFFFDTNDTFMDWFNVTIFAHTPGAYSIYQSVYPPLSFIFTRYLSDASCYRYDALFARQCDGIFPWVFGAFFVLNICLVFASYWRRDRGTAWMRTLAICLGLPMLFGIERGQLAVPCFGFFVLAYGSAVRSAPVRWLSSAMAINFKPYLFLGLIPYFVKRRWLTLEGSVIAVVAVYLITYAALGSGTPLEVFENITNFSFSATIIRFQNMFYQTSYQGILDGLNSTFPFMFFLGSQPIDLTLTIVPILERVEQAGALVCLAGAAWRPNAIPTHRLVALAISLPLTTSLVGGYAQIFLFFLVFMERSEGVACVAAIVICYALCISGDYQLLVIGRGVEQSYLGNRLVGYSVGVNLGEIIRPGLVLLIAYLLVVASMQDLWRSRRLKPQAPPQPDPPLLTMGVLDGAP